MQQGIKGDIRLGELTGQAVGLVEQADGLPGIPQLGAGIGAVPQALELGQRVPRLARQAQRLLEISQGVAGLICFQERLSQEVQGIDQAGHVGLGQRQA